MRQSLEAGVDGPVEILAGGEPPAPDPGGAAEILMPRIDT
jgi:hypothetical protein